MEWVETTARTIEEAKELALDQLGVDEDEAEFEIVEEPRFGLFGRLRSEARVRARVRPTKPRPKVDRRERRRKGQRPRGREGNGGARQQGAPAGPATTTERADDGSDRAERAGAGRGRRRRGGSADRAGQPSTTAAGPKTSHVSDNEEPEGAMEPLTLQDQAAMVEDFLSGLADAFGYTDASVTTAPLDDDAVEVQLNGSDLGLLIGPKGATLAAVHELAKAAVQHQGKGQREGRFRIDIGGYRQRRREALARFAVDVATQVRESGTSKALEPMNAADRKVLHDTVNDIEGVHTISEGEDPRRRVVILPD